MSNVRAQYLEDALQERILVLDGAMGSLIQAHQLEDNDYHGERFADFPRDLKGNNDLLSLTQPDIIYNIHKAYLDAGSDIIETNTFNATRASQSDYDLQDWVYELNKASAVLARRACEDKTAETPDKFRWAAGALGPTSRTLSLSPDVNNPAFRNITFDELADDYRLATEGLIDGGVDIILIETIFDTLNAKAAIYAVKSVFEARGMSLPIMISGTITDASGRTLSGQTTEAFWHSVATRPAHFRGAQLRPRRGGAAPVCRNVIAHCPHPGVHTPERRFAQRLWRLRRNAGTDGRGHPGIRPERPGEYRRRLLRHDARSHQSPGRRPWRSTRRASRPRGPRPCA